MTTLSEGSAGGKVAHARDVAPARVEGTGGGSGQVAVAVAAPPALVTYRRWCVRVWSAWEQACVRALRWCLEVLPRLLSVVADVVAQPRKAVQVAPVWSARPPSLADVAAYVRAGSWVPGDRAPVLEKIGKGYGYGIVLPASAILYAALWVLRRPLRLGIAVALALALWASVVIA